MSWSTSELRVRLALLNQFKPLSKIFYWPFQGGTSFENILCFFCLVFATCLYVRLFLWSPAGKVLTSLLSFVVSNCEFVTFPLVSWMRYGTWLYRFLTFAPLLTLNDQTRTIELFEYWKAFIYKLYLILPSLLAQRYPLPLSMFSTIPCFAQLQWKKSISNAWQVIDQTSRS